MLWWVYMFIFFVILFSYIHVQHQLKSGEDLEIYEYDFTTAKSLQDICQLKQPVIFALHLPFDGIVKPLEFLEIKDRRDYQQLPDSGSSNKKHIETIQVSYESGRRLLDTDMKGWFYSNRNRLNESWTKWFKKMDPFLKPPFTLYTETDIIYGSRKARTTTVFHRESHVYLYTPPESNKGCCIRVKMTPYKSSVFLDHVDDYTFYEYWSAVDLFEHHDRIQCIDFFVKPGYVLYVPPYWFYSIEFQDKENEVCMVKYTTGANVLANIKHLSLFYMQQQNIQENWLKPLGNVNTVLSYNTVEPELEVVDVSDVEKTIVEELIEELQPKS
jgi:hypothetical protein